MWWQRASCRRCVRSADPCGWWPYAGRFLPGCSLTQEDKRTHGCRAFFSGFLLSAAFAWRHPIRIGTIGKAPHFPIFPSMHASNFPPPAARQKKEATLPLGPLPRLLPCHSHHTQQVRARWKNVGACAPCGTTSGGRAAARAPAQPSCPSCGGTHCSSQPTILCAAAAAAPWLGRGLASAHGQVRNRSHRSRQGRIFRTACTRQQRNHLQASTPCRRLEHMQQQQQQQRQSSTRGCQKHRNPARLGAWERL